MTAPSERREAEERERPSRHGAELGKVLAQVAKEGFEANPELPPMCATCAFRPGSMTNQMAATLLQAFMIVMGADKDRFACHHGLNTDGQPTKLCAGYLATKHVPFARLKEIVLPFEDQMAAWGGEDPIRAKFDAWIAETDPAGEMDDYARARAYAKTATKPDGAQ